MPTKCCRQQLLWVLLSQQRSDNSQNNRRMSDNKSKKDVAGKLSLAGADSDANNVSVSASEAIVTLRLETQDPRASLSPTANVGAPSSDVGRAQQSSESDSESEDDSEAEGEPEEESVYDGEPSPEDPKEEDLIGPLSAAFNELDRRQT